MNTETQRSTFVTIIAWIFIIISGFASLISLLQNLLLRTVFNTPQFEQASHSLPANAPPYFDIIFRHLQLLLLVFLIISLFTFISSVGLLRRKNWARQIFIIIMGLGIIWSLVGIGMQFFMFSFMRGQFATTPNMPNISNMRVFFTVMEVFSGLIAIAFSVLFGIIIKKLISPPIVAEFIT